MSRTTAPYLVALVLLLVSIAHRAESQNTEFSPEIGTYVRLNQDMRLFFLVRGTSEDGVHTGFQFGSNVDLYVKPLLKLKRFTVFELDQSKSRLLTFRLGYRYVNTPGGPVENRAVLEVTPRFPLASGIFVSDRNRADLRFIDGEFFWRYRNRLSAERTFAIRSYHFSPYGRCEVFFDSNYDKWSRTAVTVGSAFPFGKHFELDGSYEHQNNTGKAPNQQVNVIGAALNLYFP
jgi:hypothetical protein